MKTKDAIRDLLNDIKEEATSAEDGNSAALCTRMLRDLETIPENYNVDIEIDEDDQVARLDAFGDPIKATHYYEESGQKIPDIYAYSVDSPVYDGQGNEVEHPALTVAEDKPYVGELYDENGLLIPEGTLIATGQLVYDANGEVVNDPSKRTVETAAKTTRVTSKVNVEAETKAKISDADGDEDAGLKGKAKSKQR